MKETWFFASRKQVNLDNGGNTNYFETFPPQRLVNTIWEKHVDFRFSLMLSLLYRLFHCRDLTAFNSVTTRISAQKRL